MRRMFRARPVPRSLTRLAFARGRRAPAPRSAEFSRALFPIARFCPPLPKLIGLDFSAEMIAIAKKMFSRIEFRQGDAQNLPFANASFDRVAANFALLHLADPERACAEAARVLKPGGRFGFTTWAKISENPFVKLVDDAIQAHANLEVDLPPGPPFYLFENEEEFRNALERAGFDGASMTFKVHN